MTDRGLLAQYATTRSEEAFEEIVSRHSAMVFSVCVRVLGDSNAAMDASQVAFLALERCASRLPRNTVLSGWLFVTARNAARKLQRAETRRAIHEREAAAVHTKEQEAASWDHVKPALDAAIAVLPGRQRDAIVLRYFEGRPEREVAEEMGCSRSTVATQLSRALGKLRENLGRQGLAVPPAVLVGFLGERTSEVVPGALNESLKATCLGKTAASPPVLSAADGMVKSITLAAKVKVAAAFMAGAVMVGGIATAVALKPRGGKPYIMGTASFPIPATDRPERGVAMEDPHFGISVTRLTDASDVVGSTIRRHAHSAFSPLNCDGSLQTVMGTGWHVYDARALRRVKRLGSRKTGPHGDHGAPRWNATDPNTFYFAAGTSLWKYEIKTDRVALVRDFQSEFPEMKWLCLPVTGNPSADRRYWGFSICRTKQASESPICSVTYDIERDRVVGRLSGTDGTFISVSPSGKRVVVNKAGKKRSYNLDFTDEIDLGVLMWGDHAIDADGREVFVGAKAKGGPICMADLATGKKATLISLQAESQAATSRETGMTAFHVSGNCYATPGWAVVSTSGHGTADPSWAHLTIFMLKLDRNADPGRPVVWRLVHHHSVKGKKGKADYWAEPHATIDRHGRSIVFASNWGAAAKPVESYRCDLPAHWYERLMGEEKARQLRSKVARQLGVPDFKRSRREN